MKDEQTVEMMVVRMVVRMAVKMASTKVSRLVVMKDSKMAALSAEMWVVR